MWSFTPIYLLNGCCIMKTFDFYLLTFYITQFLAETLGCILVASGIVMVLPLPFQLLIVHFFFLSNCVG